MRQEKIEEQRLFIQQQVDRTGLSQYKIAKAIGEKDPSIISQWKTCKSLPEKKRALILNLSDK